MIIEIIIHEETEHYPDVEKQKETRYVFLRHQKIEELKKDKGIVGDILNHRFEREEG